MTKQLALRNREPAGKRILTGIGLFLLYFILCSAYLNQGVFCDEVDNMVGGMVVADGGVVYRDFYSQHTPVMYYLCAIFRLLGASSIFQYRLFFYLTLSLIWVLMYLRYKNYVGKFAMALYPVVYAVTMCNFDGLGHMVLSEQIQSQAMVVLMIELLLFFQNKELKLSNSILISIAIAAGFGVAFMALLPIAAVFVGVLYIEISDSVIGKIGVGATIVRIWKKYWRALLIIAVPFLAAFVYFAAFGLIRNVYDQAYLLNTKVYATYTGGFGGNILNTIVSPFQNYFSQLLSSLNALFTDPFGNLRILLNYVVNIIFVIGLFKWRKSYGVIMAAFIVLTGARGFTAFHSIPYWAVCIMMGLILAARWIKAHPQWKSYSVKQAACICSAVFLIVTPYMTTFTNIVPTHETLAAVTQNVPATNSYEDYIQKLTGPEDTIYANTLNNTFYINADRFPASRMYNMVPWFADLFEDKAVEDLSNNQPKVIIYDPKGTVWDYVYEEFAPSVDRFIKENYTVMDICGPDFWVLNSYYDEAKEILSRQ